MPGPVWVGAGAERGVQTIRPLNVTVGTAVDRTQEWTSLASLRHKTWGAHCRSRRVSARTYLRPRDGEPVWSSQPGAGQGAQHGLADAGRSAFPTRSFPR